MAKKSKQRLHTLIIAVETVTAFLAIFLVTTLYANWGAVQNEWHYATHKPTPLASVSPSPSPSQPVTEAPHLVIPKLSLDVPLQWDIPADQTVDALNHGVAHLAGTAHPGETGNTFITGHSSDYVWKHNPYAATFSLLPKLTPGDIITIHENGLSYVYKVATTTIVKPTDVEVTHPTSTPIITLMTCYPIGSTRERYIVQGMLISSPHPITTVAHTDETLPLIQFR